MDNILRPLRPVEGASSKTQSLNPLRLDSPAAAASPNITLLDQSKKQTCLQCRVRKVKCDGRHKVCRNCERLEFECSFQLAPGKPSTQSGAKLPERRRRMQACLSCRSKKTRCLGELPECSNCVRKGLACAYPEPRKRLPAADSPLPGDSSNHGYDYATSSTDHEGPTDDLDIAESTGEMALGYDTLNELVEDYFKHLYPLPSYAFLHKATFVQRCHDRTVDTPLKLAICAITALLLQRTELCHDIWAQQAEQLILQQLAQPSIFRLQALLLIVRYRIESGDFPTAFMLAALAARAAVGLRLNYERSELSSLAQEARRRLFWSLFLLDDFFCVGLREFELCPQETIHLQLPCDEATFDAGRYRPTGTLTGVLQQDPSGVSKTIGLRGMFLRLVAIRREIMRFIRQVGLKELQPASVAAAIQSFEQQLKSLYSNLSQSEQYSVYNLINSKLQVQFTMLHVSWNQCFCDLYRLFLNGYSEAAPSPVLASVHPGNRDHMKRRCSEHAENILQIGSDFWHNVSRHYILERDVAVCSFEATRIVLFGASVSSIPGSLNTALRKAQLCLEMITHFFAHSAATKALKNKLEKIINSYSARLALQHKDVLREPEPPETRPSTKVSQYANSRQRLSVQSLLLQSDFVDDSDQIALPPIRYESLSPQARDTGQRNKPCTSRPASDVPPLDDRMSLDDLPEETTTPQGSEGLGDVAIDLNPWMGFPGKDDIYGIPGLSGDLDEEY